MNRPRVIGILLAAGLLGFLVWAVFCDHEPSYQGKTVTDWANRFRECGGNADEQQKCLAAIQALGTNALPVLVNMVTARDGSLKSKFIRYVNGSTNLHVHMHTAAEKHIYAALPLFCLGTNALPAVPELLHLAHSRDTEVAGLASNCLRQMLPISPTLKSLASDLHGTNRIESFRAAARIAFYFPMDAEQIGVYSMFPELSPGTTSTLRAAVPK